MYFYNKISISNKNKLNVIKFIFNFKKKFKRINNIYQEKMTPKTILNLDIIIQY